MVQDEELISNISYTNSDFRTIFPQLLDTAKKLSNKWDPSLSNESDPGNILLKELAIIGDKNNYHVDKNVLECFPLSATQESSARQLYDLVGYDMHWYKSAYCTVQFTLLKPISSIISENSDAELDLNEITLPAGTQVCDTTGEYVYTLVDQVTLSEAKKVVSATAIQGTIESYEINGNYDINIDSLDENLRLYFPQNSIAENGIFVYDKGIVGNGPNIGAIGYHNDTSQTYSNQYWGLVDNLVQYKTGSKIFKFGLDLSNDKCYIEFPLDIMDLIGNGLRIYYTSTKGENGNIKTSILNTFVNDIIVDGAEDSVVLNPYIKVSNLSTTDGKNPESLQDAYKNYKRLIGTYDTLVSRRDYNNALYNLKQPLNPNLNLISNGYVSDRTSDMNCSQSVMVNNDRRDFLQNYVKENTLNSYDIVLYLFQQPSSLMDIEDYNYTFKPDLTPITKTTIEQDLQDYKSVQHNLNYITKDGFNIVNPKFGILNVIQLVGNITTYYKVSKGDAREIEANVTNALIKAYNSRELTFGEQVDYDKLLSTIREADDRIRNVNLNIPNYEPYLQYADTNAPQSLYQVSSISAPYTRSWLNNEILAKMILSGKVQLFNFLDDFQVDFGQMNCTEYAEISRIKTSNNIEIDNNVEKTLDKNDIVQIVVPNLQVKSTYGATVRYSFQSNDPNISSVESGDTYVLQSNELKVVYLNDLGTLIAEALPSGTIIRPQGFTLQSQTWDIASVTNPQVYQEILKAGQSIEILVPTTAVIPSKSTYYYVVSNSTDLIFNQETNTYEKIYQLTLNAGVPYVLQENEYFVYTSSDTNGFIILGSGTSLEFEGTEGSNLLLESKVIDLDKVYNTSYDDIYSNSADSVWKLLNTDLIKTENEVITLTQNDSVKITNSASSITLSNTLQFLDPSVTVSYKFNGETDYIDVKPVSNLENPITHAPYQIAIRSTMLLNANSLVSQELVGNQKLYIDYAGAQDFTVVAETDNPNKGNSILFSYPIYMIGGDNINVDILNENTGKYESLLSCLVFNQNDQCLIVDKFIGNGTTKEFILTNSLERVESVSIDGTAVTSGYTIDIAAHSIKFTSAPANNKEIVITYVSDLNRKDGVITVQNKQTASELYEETSTILNYTFNETLNDILDQSLYKTNNLNYNNNKTKSVYYILPISLSLSVPEGSSNAQLTLNITDGKIGSFYDLLASTSISSNTKTYLAASGTNIIRDILVIFTDAGKNASNLTLTFTNATGDSTATIGYISRIHNINVDEINMNKVANNNYYSYDILGDADDSGTNYSEILTILKSLPGAVPNESGYPGFDWTYRVPGINKVLEPLAGESYFNPNHIYNQYTLPKIDLGNSSIKVAPSNII